MHLKGKRSFSSLLIIWLALLHYYTIFAGFAAYFFILIKKIKITRSDFIILLGLITLIILQLFIADTSSIVFVNLRFYWGGIIFYFIFKSNSVDKKTINATLTLLCILTLTEAVLINTVISPQILPNFPVYEMTSSHFAIAGNYQRPYSFGGNTTVGSSLLVVLMAICNVRGWRFWLSLSAVLVFISGTGTLILLFLLLVKYKQQIIKAALPLSCILLLISFIFLNQIQSVFDLITNKAGVEYLNFLIDYKWLQIMDAFSDATPYTFMFGNSNGFRGGDFGALAFILANGVFGFSLFLSLILSRINKTNRFPLLLSLIASFHYPVVFFLPGQMIFGLLLSINKDNFFDETEQIKNSYNRRNRFYWSKISDPTQTARS